MNIHKTKNGHKTQRILVAIGIFAAILIILYIALGLYYKKHYLPRTEINGVSIGNLSLEKANEKFYSVLSDYNLIIYGREDDTYDLKGSDFGFSYNSDSAGDTLSALMETQNSFAWPVALFNGSTASLDFSDCYDDEALSAAVLSLSCFDEDTVTAPQDASLQLNEEETAFEIADEIMGNKLKEDAVITCIGNAVNELATDVTLTDEYYETPEIYADDKRLSSCLEDANSRLGATITYDIADYEEVVDTEKIASWLKIDDDFNVSLDTDAIADYVQYLASTYNTYADVRDFKTSSGDTIQIGGGDYGWVVDKEAEAKQLISDISSGEAIEREPVYSQTAVSRSKNDIGDTYIEIDYTKQHLWYYENGALKLDTDIVSGNINKGNGSPDGVFKIVYKKSPATLVGEDYESDVNYFMVFAYNVGIHDASWRDSFGGEIYKTSGSHGCINIEGSVAASLYEMLESGTPVIAYYRDSVQLTAENAKISNAYSYVEPEESAAQ